MKGRRHTPEQVVRNLREAGRLPGEGQELPEVCKVAGASGAAMMLNVQHALTKVPRGW